MRLRSTDGYMQSNHGDVKYSIKNIVNNIVVTMYGGKKVLEIWRGSFLKVYKCLTTMLYTGN